MHKLPAVAGSPLPSEASQPEVIAAVDLGSNSFHMVVGELRDGQLIIVDRLRESVRLAEDLSASGKLSAAARQRALDCLTRFGERLGDFHVSSVRAAGTATIRRAREDALFMAEAEARLGYPIEVISGVEEARLVYQGVTKTSPRAEGLRLVADIGGGSTEVILGQDGRPRTLESLPMGCVSMTERFFSDGRLTRAQFGKARVAARLELKAVAAVFGAATEYEAIGTSGTIRATQSVAQALELTTSTLSPEIIEALIDAVLRFDTIDQITIAGLSERRAQVWPGGLCILVELLVALRITAMQVSDGALREGLLYDLLGDQ